MKEEIVLYRVGSQGEGAARPLGRWYTDRPLASEAQLRIDAAIKPVWKGTDGTLATSEGITRAKSPADLLIVVRVPRGTVIYKGPVSPQSDNHLGGNDQIQYFVPDTGVLKVQTITPFADNRGGQPPEGDNSP